MENKTEFKKIRPKLRKIKQNLIGLDDLIFSLFLFLFDLKEIMV